MGFKYYSETEYHVFLEMDLESSIEFLNKEHNALSFEEDIPFPWNEIYKKPKFTINDLVEKITISRIKSLQIIGFLSKPEGIEKFSNLKQLCIDTYDVSYYKIKRLVGKEKTFFKVDLSWYPKLKSLRIGRLDNVFNIEKTELTSLIISGDYVLKKFVTIDFPETLQSLEFAGVSKLKDFSVLKKIKNLKKLKFLSCNNLMCFSGLEEIENLEELIIEDYNKIDVTNLKSESLKRLEISKEGRKPIPSIHFIKNLPKLEYVSFVCNIEDKDVSPLIKHPNLKEIHPPYHQKCNYSLDEIYEIRTNGWENFKAKSNDIITFFNRIDVNKLDQCYDTTITIKGQDISIDINFTEKKTKHSLLNQIKNFIKEIEVQDQKNKSFIHTNYTDKNSNGVVRDYLNYHFDELEDIVNCNDTTKSPREQLLEKIKLERIGFYPNEKQDRFIVFDYNIGLTNYLLAICLNKQGEFISLDIES